MHDLNLIVICLYVTITVVGHMLNKQWVMVAPLTYCLDLQLCELCTEVLTKEAALNQNLLQKHLSPVSTIRVDSPS